MAKQYVVTEEEMVLLSKAIELQEIRKDNEWWDDPDRPTTAEDLCRCFNAVVTQWQRLVGYESRRYEGR